MKDTNRTKVQCESRTNESVWQHDYDRFLKTGKRTRRIKLKSSSSSSSSSLIVSKTDEAQAHKRLTKTQVITVGEENEGGVQG